MTHADPHPRPSNVGNPNLHRSNAVFANVANQIVELTNITQVNV